MGADRMKPDGFGDFIDNQRQFSGEKGTLGPWGNLCDNGCGVIAVYNLVKYLGREAGISELILETNRSWFRALGLGGRLGVRPGWIKRLLGRRGFRMRFCFQGKYLAGNSSLPEIYRAYLVLYLWREKYRIGAHYQAAWQREDGKVITWNGYGADDGFAAYMKRKREKENLVWMWVWGVGSETDFLGENAK